MSFRYLLCADIILLIISFHSNKDRCYQLDIAERETESRKRSPAHQVWLDFQVHILNPKLYCFPQVPLFCTYDIPARACALLRHERDELGSLKCSLVSWRSFAEHAANGPTLGGSFFSGFLMPGQQERFHLDHQLGVETNLSKVVVLRDDTKHDLIEAIVSLSLEGEASSRRGKNIRVQPVPARLSGLCQALDFPEA